MAEDASTEADATTDTDAAEDSTTDTGNGDATLAEIKALADELGITPGQLKGRLEASKKWEQRAKANGTAAQTATDRAQAAQQQLRQVAQLLGLADDDATPEKLQAQLADRDAQVAQRDELLAGMLRERQAERAARRHGADVDLIMPALTYNGLLDGLDPSGDDFAANVDTVVADFVKSNPKYLASAGFPDLRQGNQGHGAAASNDPNAWLRRAAGRM